MRTYHFVLALSMSVVGCVVEDIDPVPIVTEVCNPGDPQACLCSSKPIKSGVTFCRYDGSGWDDGCYCEDDRPLPSKPPLDAGSCAPDLPSIACGMSECGIRADGCGGAYNCGTSIYPLCAGTGQVCIFTAKTDGVCASAGECITMKEGSGACPIGQNLTACNFTAGYRQDDCKSGTGICAPYKGPALKLTSFVPAILLSCCTPCELP